MNMNIAKFALRRNVQQCLLSNSNRSYGIHSRNLIVLVRPLQENRSDVRFRFFRNRFGFSLTIAQKEGAHRRNFATETDLPTDERSYVPKVSFKIRAKDPQGQFGWVDLRSNDLFAVRFFSLFFKCFFF